MTICKHISRIDTAVDRDLQWIWVMNAKTAGESIRRMIRSRVVFSWEKGHRALLNESMRGMPYIWTIVRNPWDRVVSAWEHLRQNKNGKLAERFRRFYGHLSFDKFVLGHLNLANIEVKSGLRAQPDHHFHKQIECFSFHGKQYTDFIARFENLHEDWKRIASEINAPSGIPHRLNASVRRPYRDYYTPKTRDMVTDVYREEIDVLGYEF